MLLGVLSSLLTGTSDTFGRASAKRSHGVTHVITATFVGVAVALIAAIVLEGQILARDMLLGAVSGVLLGAGLARTYEGMARASSAVVSPTAGVFAVLIPIGWDITSGSRPAPLVWFGVGIALSALVLTTWNPDLGESPTTGFVYGATAGVLFGISVTVIGQTSPGSEAWPVVAERFSGFVAMVLLARRWKIPVVLPDRVRRFGILGGIAGTLGVVCFVAGAQRGDLASVSVAAAMYPAVTVVLSTIFDGDQIRWWQGVGVVGAITGVALIALG